MGIDSGDTVLLHSSMIDLNWRDAGGMRNLVSQLYNDLRSVLGSHGTLIVPTFSFDFTDESPHGHWSLEDSESDMGALTEYVRQNEESSRTVHPFYSFSVVGARSEDIAQLHSTESFSREYVFGYVHQQDAKILILGTDYNNAMTFFHYIEKDNTVDVDYRHDKSFEGTMDIRGKVINAKYSMMVRNLDMGVETNVNPMGYKLEEENVIDTGNIGGGTARLGNAKTIYNETTRIMNKDKQFLYEINEQ
jgi:aminoglycoside 3-N-acetyltransferase